MDNKKTAVILFQLGGPDSLDAVNDFLYNLFCDPDIFDFPLAFLLRKPLAAILSQSRARVVKHHYITIGGKSPILELTRLQADALETELRKHIDAKVFIAMRYSAPTIESVVASLAKSDFDEYILLPLYPHYSKTTSGSSFNEWKRQSLKISFQPKQEVLINNFHDNGLYIDSLVEQINNSLKKFGDIPAKDIHIVFSAHGVPESLIASGDPYKQQTERTVELVTQRGKWESPHTLCYQSKVGPLKWLQPTLQDTVKSLAETGTRYLLVVPISFVCDHIETLHEIDIQTRTLAEGLGVKQFEMMPALNAHPKFIEALKEMVLEVIK